MYTTNKQTCSEIRTIVSTHSTSHNMEVQQRSVEYSALFSKHDNLRPGVLEPMPNFDKPSSGDGDEGNDGNGGGEEKVDGEPEPTQEVPAPQEPQVYRLFFSIIMFI